MSVDRFSSAAETARAVNSRHVTAVRVADDVRARIAAEDHKLNAFLALNENARTDAAAIDAAVAVSPLPLAGVPVGIKDLTDTNAITTTYGSALYKNHVPVDDDLVVARLKTAGAVVIGKTMTPEFGFGAICGNALKNPTSNPWALELTSGGSSGGSAAAVAAGLVPLAHGTDFGGSVRTPASFCGVLSLRPTPGIIPNPKRAIASDTLASHGVIARSVEDLRLFLEATAGPEPRDPTSRSLTEPVGPMSGPLNIATTSDFGVAPVSRAVRAAFADACSRIPSGLGTCTPAHPACDGAIPAFHLLRQSLVRHSYGHLLDVHAEALSKTVRWAIKQGEGIAAADYLRAEARRWVLYRDFVALFETFDVLLAPAASVLPWPNTMPDVTEIDGAPLPTVIDYLAVTFLVSMAACPVVTLPAWTAGELPFGIQLIGRPGSDLRLLEIAGRFERECGFGYRPPPIMGEALPPYNQSADTPAPCGGPKRTILETPEIDNQTTAIDRDIDEKI